MASISRSNTPSEIAREKKRHEDDMRKIEEANR